MRVLFGMILGVLLTFGVAYVHDTWTVPSTTTGTSSPPIAQRNMVNWDVVDQNWRLVQQRAKDTWTALSHKIAS